jgi:hypothetical protein
MSGTGLPHRTRADFGFLPAFCLTADEAADWWELNRRTGGEQAADPCIDCTHDWRRRMIRAGRCEDQPGPARLERSA